MVLHYIWFETTGFTEGYKMASFYPETQAADR